MLHFLMRLREIEHWQRRSMTKASARWPTQPMAVRGTNLNRPSSTLANQRTHWTRSVAPSIEGRCHRSNCLIWIWITFTGFLIKLGVEMRTFPQLTTRFEYQSVLKHFKIWFYRVALGYTRFICAWLFSRKWLNQICRMHKNKIAILKFSSNQ